MRPELTLRRTLLSATRTVWVSLLAGSAALILGCGGTGGGGSLVTPPASGSASDVYVISTSDNGTQGSILDFSAHAQGEVAPKGTLSLPTAMIPYSVATDSTGQIYVGGYTTPNYEILVYPAGSTGAATPSRTILTGTENDPSAVAAGAMSVDTTGNLYVVGFAGSVAVYAPAANGITGPTRLITFDVADEPVGVAVDSTGAIYVSAEIPNESGETATGTILVFSSGATGASTPVRQITSPDIFFGIAVDASANVYATLLSITVDSNGLYTGATSQIVEFSTSASGAAAPTKSITIPSNGDPVAFAAGLRTDTAGNLYTTVQTASTLNANAVLTTSVMGFAPTATGSAVPTTFFTSSSWAYPGMQLALH